MRMADDDKILTLFTTRVRQMILQYKDLKKENDELYAMVDSRDDARQVWSRHAKITKASRPPVCLKSAMATLMPQSADWQG